MIVRRKQSPGITAPFKVPLYPLTPILAIAGCLWIIKDLRSQTLLAFIGWTAFALIFYFAYSVRNSRLNKTPEHAAHQ
ncbi:amino acid permease C-terminal domain-containing protein [Pseudarthrobacter oxydans]|uniref:amino acid permease C-terminal domain-containing protein n=1 Tax=Pseudarthrobacter oxydans TaxID=1671 RepID=UPI00382D813A